MPGRNACSVGDLKIGVFALCVLTAVLPALAAPSVITTAKSGPSSPRIVFPVTADSAARKPAESKLGTVGFCFYGEFVTGFLRFLGVFNAAVWFGAVVFFLFGVSVLLDPAQGQAVFRTAESGYFSRAAVLAIQDRFYTIQWICAAVALVHLWTERWYLGRRTRRRWDGLLLGALILALWGDNSLVTRLNQLHKGQYARDASPQLREASAKSFRNWQRIATLVHLYLLFGAGACLWRAANPEPGPRFLSTSKLRS